MAYAISGRAGDPLLARCEWVGTRIQQLNPAVTVRFDPKHPSEWDAFQRSMEKNLDLAPLTGGGPVVWTPEGRVMSADGWTVLAKESFGVTVAPVGDPMYDAIAAEQEQAVETARELAAGGMPLGEKLEQTYAARAAHLNHPRDLQRVTVTQQGVAFQVWSSPELRHLYAEYRALYGGAAGREGTMMIDDRDMVTTVLDTHVLTLALRPAVPKHAVLAPVRLTEREDAEFIEKGEEEATTYMQLKPFVDAPTPLDFAAVAHTLQAVNGVATLQRIPDPACEFRSPLDQHIQILPFPLVDGLDAPLLPLLQRKRDGSPEGLPFAHSLQWLDPQGRLEKDLPKAFAAAEAELGLSGDYAFDLVMARDFLLLAPLRLPGAGEAAAWTALPPCPPVGLLGLVLLPEVEPQFPETTGAPWGTSGKKVSKDRILSTVYQDPLEVLGYWR